MHIILAGTGNVGQALQSVLISKGIQVHITSRRAQHGNPAVKQCNLLNLHETMAALKGYSVAYLTAGLPYNTAIWQKQWPLIISNVLHACRVHGCKLVFLDNVYALQPQALSNITEDSPIGPTAKKGAVRAGLLQQLITAMQVQPVLIARSADFYGRGCSTGFLNQMVFTPLARGRAAVWQASAAQVHSFTYLADIAAAMAMLALTPAAYGQVWHMPTSAERLTGAGFVTLTAGLLHVKPKLHTIPLWAMRALGLVNPLMHELAEMAYQYSQPYFFNSTKFNTAFNYMPTPYAQGIAASLQ